mgnify:CR=1 FL=1
METKNYNDAEIVRLVKSITTSLPYCAPEALDGLLYDKMSPLVFGLRRATLRIAELESMLAEDENGEVDTEGLMLYDMLCRDDDGDNGEISEGWEDNVIQ